MKINIIYLLFTLLFYIILLAILYQAVQRDREYGSTFRERAIVLLHPTIIIVAISALGPVLENIFKSTLSDNALVISVYDFALIFLDDLYSFSIPTSIIFCLCLVRSKKITIQSSLAIYIFSVVSADLVRHLSGIASAKWQGIPMNITTEVDEVLLSLLFDFLGALPGGVLIFACFRFFFQQQKGKILLKKPATTYSWFMIPSFSLFVVVIVFGLFIHVPDAKFLYTQTDWHNLKIRFSKENDDDMYAYFKPRFTAMGFHSPSKNEVVKVELYKKDGKDTAKAAGINAFLRGFGPSEMSRYREKWPPEDLAEEITRQVDELISTKGELISRVYNLEELWAQKDTFVFAAQSNKAIPVRIALQKGEEIFLVNSLDDLQYAFLGFGAMPDMRDWIVMVSAKPLCSVLALDANIFFSFQSMKSVETSYAETQNDVAFGKDVNGYTINITDDLVDEAKQHIGEQSWRYVWPVFYSSDRGAIAKLCVTSFVFTDGPLSLQNAKISELISETGDGVISIGGKEKTIKKGQGLKFVVRKMNLTADNGKINISGDGGVVWLGDKLINLRLYEEIPTSVLGAMAGVLLAGFGVILVFSFRKLT